MLVNDLQSSKAYQPIDVTLSGIVTLVNASQYLKAFLPIDFTLSGIVLH